MTKRAAGILCVSLLALSGAIAQKRKSRKPDEEPKPQILGNLPELPDAIAVETGRLSFQVSPLSDKGLLSQQARDAIKAIARLNHGGTIVKLRAFVAGSGDLRRIKEIVAEEMTERKQPLPVVSTIQVGALPMTGAQVVMEAVSSEKKVVNPAGLVIAASGAPRSAAAAVGQLQASFAQVGVKAPQVLRVTCFLGSLEDSAPARAAVAAAFPMSSANFVQRERLGVEVQVTCEGIGQLSGPVVEQSGLAAAHSGFALLSQPKLVLTGAQLVFRDQDADFRLAYQRLTKTIAGAGANPQDVIWRSAYVLAAPDAGRIESAEREFLGRSRDAAGLVVQVEGLPSTDATAAIEWIAAVR